MRRPRALLVAAALLGMGAAGFYLRLRHNGYGLPYVYNYDEATHFTNHSVHMLGSDLDPGYYQNPSGFTYLGYFALRGVYGLLGAHLHYGTIGRQFKGNDTPIFEVTRGLAAVLAMAGMATVFWVGRRVWGTAVGLVAAALLTFAFLPVTYSRIAVTDVAAFLPVALSLYGAVLVYERGRWRDYLLAGAGAGLAVGFKYTAGLVILPTLVAGGLRLWREPGPLVRRPALRALVLAGAGLVVAFAITTPYFFAHPVRALYQIKNQASAAGGTAKLGQSQEGGFVYYLKSFTWGFGWAAIAAAIAGAVLELRRDRRRALMLLSFPVVLYIYMGAQSRYFGRWMLPMYPLLALLAAVAIVWLARGVPARQLVQVLVGAAALAAVLVQPLAADVRTATVLGRTDTRQILRDYLAAHYPRGLRVVIEPAVPDSYYDVGGDFNRRKQLISGFVLDIRRQAGADAPEGTNSTYATTLQSGLIDRYRQSGFCLVATMSVIRGRAENAQLPEALAYYRRLERDATQILHVTPFKRGRKPVPLHYDFSYDYYPTAYYRPGPDVRLYRLKGCRQQYGRAPIFPAGTRGLDKGEGTSYLRSGLR
ncbi:MAG: glycosyltransferase family 39 protein [Actinobacteria bacterium]|nr:MAG: glycosyltransferase family 39 protein [Actinomycetota bacterium]